MSIELLLILREYHRMGAIWRWLARTMFPVLAVVDVPPESVERMLTAHYARLREPPSP